MKLRELLAFAALGVILVLRPLAFASPPDQSWLGGLWDDDDYDNVILLITGHGHAVSGDTLGPGTPVFSVVFSVVESGDRSVLTPPLPSHESRAPPLAV